MLRVSRLVTVISLPFMICSLAAAQGFDLKLTHQGFAVDLGVIGTGSHCRTSTWKDRQAVLLELEAEVVNHEEGAAEPSSSNLKRIRHTSPQIFLAFDWAITERNDATYFASQCSCHFVA